MDLSCCVQNYAWGKVGLDSAVARLHASVNKEFAVDDSAPYAELWMGTHPNGPSKICANGKSLRDYVAENPVETLGQKSLERFGSDLPFLFKVLSVKKALSIQAHPNKTHAEMLHAERPDVYKDPNHKPEMAIALTVFEGLCGFRPLGEIQRFLMLIPELSGILGPMISESLLKADNSNYEKPLKEAFSSLMSAEKSLLKTNMDALLERLKKNETRSVTENLFLRLAEQFPGDVGCFVIFFTNHLTLTPGEAMYLGPNLIHAYLSGDCIECMACSDNVVRAGLTPKLIDVPTLCGMLEYKCHSPDEMKFIPSREEDGILLYNPPVPDFAVAKVSVTKGNTLKLPKRSSASILLVTEGKGTLRMDSGTSKEIKEGSVIFFGSNSSFEVTADNDGEDIAMFQAFCQ